MISKKPIQGINNLALLRPDITKDWNYDENKKGPYEYAVFSSQIVSWKCKKGHTYKKAISERTRTDGKATGCPYCANKKVWPSDNDLKTWCIQNGREDVLMEWDYKVNHKLPSEYLPHTDKKVDWICQKKHSYKMRICDKTKNKPYGCPVCSGKQLLVGYNDLKTLFPEVAAEWDYDENDTLPEDHIAGTHDKVHWICSKCGYRYEAQIKERTYGKTGCPKCSFYYKTSVPEQAIYYYARKAFPDAVNSYRSDFLNGMEIDVFIPSQRIGIEYDGKFWHNSNERDGRKSEILKENGIKLIRIKEANDWNTYEDFAVIHSEYDDNICQLDSAIKQLFMIIEEISNNRISVDINLTRDASSIYALSEGIKRSRSLLASGSEVLSEWAYDLNGSLTPDKITLGSHKKVWWICSKCNQPYQQSIKTKIKAGLGCESCNKTAANNRRTQEKIASGKIKSVADYPLLLKEWNDPRDPKTVSYGNDKHALWKCSACGNEFSMIVKARTIQGQGCSKCGRKSQAISRGKPVINVTTGEEYYSIAEAERRTGVAQATIRGCCNGKYKQAGGFVWQFK
ncbi:MAG: zinc-ribbon domain-containing protein [Erysipelotrichaceae bacterium]|nr:zinc-ribbon domain-containing protein [Erysipelotrichaceae bacterium]